MEHAANAYKPRAFRTELFRREGDALVVAMRQTVGERRLLPVPIFLTLSAPLNRSGSLSMIEEGPRHAIWPGHPLDRLRRALRRRPAPNRRRTGRKPASASRAKPAPIRGEAREAFEEVMGPKHDRVAQTQGSRPHLPFSTRRLAMGASADDLRVLFGFDKLDPAPRAEAEETLARTVSQ